METTIIRLRVMHSCCNRVVNTIFSGLHLAVYRTEVLGLKSTAHKGFESLCLGFLHAGYHT